MATEQKSADEPIRLDKLMSLKAVISRVRRRPPPLTVVLGAILTVVIAAAYVAAAVGLVATYFLWDDAALWWLFVVIVLGLILVSVGLIGYRAAKFMLLGHPADNAVLFPTAGVLLVCAALGAGLLLELLTGEGAPWQPTMLYPLGLAVIGLVAGVLYETRSAKAFVAASKHLFPTMSDN